MTIKGGINHITLRVQNIKRADIFYSGILGLKRVGHRSGMNFYSSGLYNHELALVEDSSITLADIQQSGLVHIAFNIEDMQALKMIYQDLIDAEYPVSTGVDHNISHSFYTRDVDGYLIELTTDCASHEWEQNPHAFKWDKSLWL